MLQLIKPESGNVFVVVAYDITVTKTRNALIKILKSYGFRVQKSVFETQSTTQKIEEMCARIDKFIKLSDEDTIRVYCIPYGGKLWYTGKSSNSCEIVTRDTIVI